MTRPAPVDLPPMPSPDDALRELDEVARDHDHYEYGLPFYPESPVLEDLRAVMTAYAQLAINDALERAAVAVMAERVDAEETGEDADYAYNRALDHAQAAVRALKGKT